MADYISGIPEDFNPMHEHYGLSQNLYDPFNNEAKEAFCDLNPMDQNYKIRRAK